jgi:signal transduction histidine kinase
MVELDQVLGRLAEGVRQVLQADAAAVCLLDGDDAHLTVTAASGLPAESWSRESIEVAGSPLDREALSGRPIIVADAHTDPRATNVPGDYFSILCVPLMHEGSPVGTLHVYAVAPQCFCEEHAALLMPLADLGAATVVAARALTMQEESEASKAHFIHVAAHELRSPITVTQSLVRGVLKGYLGELTDQQIEVFMRISRRLDFLEGLVNDILDLAEAESLKLTWEERPVLLNAAVGQAVLLLQPRAEEKGLEITLRPYRRRLVVWGTEEGLSRIFVNLISNAVKYTPSGGIVTVSMRQVDEQAQVEVTDTGIGIPEEAFPHLFEEFYRAPNAKALEEIGTGLGLTIVKDLVERYDGHVDVESIEGQGSTFTVTFPVHRLAE